MNSDYNFVHQNVNVIAVAVDDDQFLSTLGNDAGDVLVKFILKRFVWMSDCLLRAPDTKR